MESTSIIHLEMEEKNSKNNENIVKSTCINGIGCMNFHDHYVME